MPPKGGNGLSPRARPKVLLSFSHPHLDDFVKNTTGSSPQNQRAAAPGMNHAAPKRLARAVI
jgi:hypothetical protein